MIFKAILFTIGVILFLIYALPLVTIKLNIGNAIGICYSLAIIICAIAIKFFVTKLLLILLLISLIVILLTIVKIQSASKSNDTDCDAIIILGCRVKGDKPSLALEERCKAGAKYLEKHKNTIAILSGGQGNDELISEADCMLEQMTKLGVDISRLICERQSTSTYENIKFSKEITDKLNKSDHIGIVSSEYHLYRAGIIAKDAGYKSILLIPAKTVWYCKPTFYTREAIGVWAKRLKIKE